MKTALLGFGLPTGIALAMLALATVPIGVAAEAPDKSSPTSQFLTAYNSMSLADWLKEKGMRAEATDLYTEALNLFLKVSADYPQWQPAVVSFRINYCRVALQRLQGAGKEDRERRTTPLKAGQADLSRVARDDRRQTTDKHVERGASSATSAAKWPLAPQRGDVVERTVDDQKSKIGNRQLEIISLSPLNFKLQQAAFKERGRDYTGALAMYIALLEEFPREPWALKGACRCCLRLGRMDKARTLTRQALTLPLPDADLNLLAALVDCYDGRYQLALTRLRQSLKQNGVFWSPEAHAALGVALTAIGEMKEAQEEMKRALSLNPKLGDAYYNLARLSLKQKPKDHDTPRVHYQNALRHGAAPDPELDALLAE